MKGQKTQSEIRTAMEALDKEIDRTRSELEAILPSGDAEAKIILDDTLLRLKEEYGHLEEELYSEKD